jgi:hypothetical protein
VTEVVLDASVLVKGAFPDRAREAHPERALNILHAVRAGRLFVVEPPALAGRGDGRGHAPRA